MTTPRIKNDLGPLQSLMLLACPPDANNVVSVALLAKAMKCSRPTLYRWIEAGRIPPAGAKKLIAASEGRVSREDVHAYVYA